MLDSIYQLGYKARAGIGEAQAEIEYRTANRHLLPLSGLNGETMCLTALPELQRRAAELRQLYQRVPESRRTKDVILLDACSSATIEGARTTVERVSRCFSHPDSKDERMVVNTVKGSNYAYKAPITPDNIRHLWEIVVKDVCENERCAGTLYRDGMVFIGSSSQIIHTPAQPDQIKPLMDQAFTFMDQDELDVLLKAFVFHFCFVYIHPFCDGNGRTARIINASQLYFGGIEHMRALPLVTSINKNLGSYYRSLKESEYTYGAPDSRWLDLTPFVSYMLDMFEQCLIDAALAGNALSASESLLLDKMNRVGPGAEITAVKAASALGLSQSGARKVLRKLVQKGYLELLPGSRPYIYRLSPGIPQ